MKRILSYVLTMIMALALVNVNVLATEIVAPVDMPEAVDNVITLQEGVSYNGLTITDAVTIKGNGAVVVGKIVVNTDEEVVMEDLFFAPETDLKIPLVIRGVKTGEDEEANYAFNVSIKDVTFGNDKDDPATHWIYFEVNKNQQRGSTFNLEGSTFYGAGNYSVFQLSAENIKIDRNNFYGRGVAIQYSINEYNKDNITITNNEFNKTGGNSLVLTISDETFKSETVNIGNVVGNTFKGEGRKPVVSVSEAVAETIVVPFNEGLLPEAINFSAYSLNPKFRVTPTGPLTEASEGILNYGPLYVRFQVDGMQQQEVYYNGKAVEPTAPTKEGHTFDGWYKDVELKTAWKFDEDVVLNDVELYAKWNINSYKVTFKDHDDKVIGEVQTIEYGKGALKPKDPVREGYTFKGWDKAFDKVTGDLVVKAEYLANPKAEVEADKKEIEVEVKGLDDAVTFTEAERQNEVGVKLEVSVLEEKDVPKADQKLIDDFIKETLKVEDAKVLVLDISLFKVVGKETSAVHDANKPITISFKLPEAYVGLEFEILRVHDGKVEKLKYDYDEKTQMVSFETDKFSTYAVAAKAADEEKKPEDKLPGMGDNSHAGWLFLLAGGLLLIASKRKGFARK